MTPPMSQTLSFPISKWYFHRYDFWIWPPKILRPPSSAMFLGLISISKSNCFRQPCWSTHLLSRSSAAICGCEWLGLDRLPLLNVCACDYHTLQKILWMIHHSIAQLCVKSRSKVARVRTAAQSACSARKPLLSWGRLQAKMQWGRLKRSMEE